LTSTSQYEIVFSSTNPNLARSAALNQMAEFKFFCPQCGQHILCDTGHSGMQINCPVCQQSIVVPRAPVAAPITPQAAPVYSLPQSMAPPGGRYPVTPVAQRAVTTKSRTLQSALIIVVAVLVLVGFGVGGWLGYTKFKMFSQRGQLPSGLVALWSGEDNANDSLGKSEGQVLNQTGFAPGKVGKAFDFDGVGSYVNVPSNPAIKMTGPFTIMAWINYSRTSGNYQDSVMVVTKGIDAVTSMDWGLGISPAQKLRPHAQIGPDWIYFDCDTTLQTGVWYQVAMVYSGTNIQGFVNGTADGNKVVSGALLATDNPLRIGAYASVYPPAFFSGKIDELALYNRALSAEEIQKIYSEQK
jgi:hypothetical protein